MMCQLSVTPYRTSSRQSYYKPSLWILLLIAILGISVFATVARNAARQRDAIATLRESGWTIAHRSDLEDGPEHGWASRVFGVDFVDGVAFAQIGNDDKPGIPGTRTDIDAIGKTLLRGRLALAAKCEYTIR